jgi:hypothetical protein
VADLRAATPAEDQTGKLFLQTVAKILGLPVALDEELVANLDLSVVDGCSSSLPKMARSGEVNKLQVPSSSSAAAGAASLSSLYRMSVPTTESSSSSSSSSSQSSLSYDATNNADVPITHEPIPIRPKTNIMCNVCNSVLGGVVCQWETKTWLSADNVVGGCKKKDRNNKLICETCSLVVAVNGVAYTFCKAHGEQAVFMYVMYCDD